MAERHQLETGEWSLAGILHALQDLHHALFDRRLGPVAGGHDKSLCVRAGGIPF